MVNQPIAIYTIATTKDIIAVLYYNSDPLAEVQRVVKLVGDDNSNYMFVGVDPGAATIRYYESDDGTALTTLLGTFQLNISETRAVLEERFWYVGKGRTDGNGDVYDPEPDAFSFTDNYLDGKILTSLNKRGSGPTEEGIEWSRSGNTISILNPENQTTIDGPVFAANDVWVGMISYLQEIVVQAPQTRIYHDEITEDTVLTSGHRNKWLYLNGSATRLNLTAEPISTIPDGDWYGFICNGGNQFQTVFQVEDGNEDAINVNGEDKSQVVIGRFERWQIFKRGDKFEILQGLEYLANIGQFFKSHNRTEKNALWCDGVDRNGDDYPRIYEHIKNMQDSLNNPTVLADREGCFYWWTTGTEPNEVKHFRTPNKQNAFSRNLKVFASLGADTERLNDIPGGKQIGKTKKHRHLTVVSSGENNNQFPGDRSPSAILTALRSIRMWWQKNDGGGKESYYLDSSASEPSVGRTSETGENLSDEGYPDNQADFEFVRI